jgi:putative SOS response-associated peptidase YedK
MCGRYASSRPPDLLVDVFEIDQVDGDLSEHPLEPDYNVAPTKDVYAVLERRPRDEPEAPAVRRLHAVRWGLVPSWAKDPSIGNKLINARVETVADKPAFRRAFSARRCLLPADGYYEWYAEEGAGKRSPKQPFFIRPREGGVLAMAGLYEFWRDASRKRDDPQGWLWSAAVITTDAPDDLGRIHERMPMLVAPEHWARWLDPSASDPDELAALLVPAAPGLLEAYPVSREVNDVRHEGPQLIEPLPADNE